MNISNYQIETVNLQHSRRSDIPGLRNIDTKEFWFWIGNEPSVELHSKNIQTRQEENSQKIEVFVDDLNVGSFECRSVEGISLGGKVFPLAVLREQDMKESGFLVTLHEIQNQACLYILDGTKAFLSKEKALIQLLNANMNAIKN